MSVVVSSEFGPRKLLQQRSEVKWRIKIDENFFVYLGAPKSVRSAKASQAEVAPVVSDLKSTCKEIIHAIAGLSRVKLFYETYESFSFAHPFPRGVEVHVKGRLKDRLLKPDEVTKEVKNLCVLLVEKLPQYDVTLRADRIEMLWEVASKDWDTRDVTCDSIRASWDTVWRDNAWESEILCPTEDARRGPLTCPEGATGAGWITLTDTSTGEVTNTALYFSQLQMISDEKHPEFVVSLFMGHNGYNNSASVIVVSVNGKTACVDVRKHNGTWLRYARELEVTSHFISGKNTSGLKKSTHDESLANRDIAELRRSTNRRVVGDVVGISIATLLQPYVVVIGSVPLVLLVGGSLVAHGVKKAVKVISKN